MCSLLPSASCALTGISDIRDASLKFGQAVFRNVRFPPIADIIPLRDPSIGISAALLARIDLRYCYWSTTAAVSVCSLSTVLSVSKRP